MATSNAERLLQEQELECAGRAVKVSKAGNKRRRKKERRGLPLPPGGEIGVSLP